jgi:hypothetical protein
METTPLILNTKMTGIHVTRYLTVEKSRAVPYSSSFLADSRFLIALI